MKTSRIIWIALSIVSITSLVAADGLLGDKRGGSGGSSSGSGNGGNRGGGSGGSGGGDRGGSGGGSDRGGSGGNRGGGSGGSGGGDRGGSGGGSGSGGTRVPSGGSSGGSGGSRGGSGGGSDRGGSGGGSDRGGDGGSTRVPSGGSRSGNGGPGGPPGRPDNGGNGGSTRVDSRSTNTGRSGRVEYRTQNNMNRGGRPTGSIRIDSVPDFRPGIGGQSRDERSLPGNSRYRTGYYQYNNTWCDDNFWYPHYQFNYSSRNCVVSPWYYYSNLPAYIDGNRVRFDLRCANIGVTVTWNWNSGNRYDRYSNDYYLNNSINDLNAVFSRRDMRALDRLVPQNDYIYIHSDGGRDYSIPADDYFDMMRDLVTSTRTRVFSIQRVETSRGYAEVFAKHVYQDAWGYESSVYLTFILEQDRRGGYTISEFGSSNRCDY